MGKAHPALDDDLKQFIATQQMFFVASAPLAPDGNVNLSPKGRDSFRILGPSTVAYLDLTGSGIETVAHVKENRRITVMFCAFEGPPRILRLYGRGRVVELGDSGFEQLESMFPKFPSARAVVVIELTRISTSCGFGVPLMRYEGERNQLERWVENKGEGGLRTYREMKNAISLDGLPGFGRPQNPATTK